MIVALLVLILVALVFPGVVRFFFGLIALLVFAAFMQTAQAAESGALDDLLATRPSGWLTQRPPEPWSKAETAASPRPADAKFYYLSDLLRSHEAYRLAFNQLAFRIDPPTWVRRFQATGDGVQLPVHRFDIGRHRFQVAPVCRPHSATECLYIVFDTQPPPTAWALISVDGLSAWSPSPPLEVAEHVEQAVAAGVYQN